MFFLVAVNLSPFWSPHVCNQQNWLNSFWKLFIWKWSWSNFLVC